MKKAISCIIILFLVVTISISVTLTTFAVTIYNYSGYLYTYITNELVSLYGVDEDITEVTVPAIINTRPVVDIRNTAFMDNDLITAVDFSKAQYLERIGVFAFSGCSNIVNELVIPESVVIIETAAFQSCTSVASVVYNAACDTIPGQCFNRCTSLSSVTLNDNVTTIGSYAFANCPNLSYMVIPASVTAIDNSAFQNDDITLGVYNNSYAHQYAENRGIDYIILDPPEQPTEPPTEAPTEEPTVAPTDVPTESVTETQTEEPTVVPTQQPTETSGYYLGDVNGDHVADVIDSTLIQRYLASVAYPDTCVMKHGDVDGDGVVTILDATYIGRYNARIDVRYPIGEWQAE